MLIFNTILYAYLFLCLNSIFFLQCIADAPCIWTKDVTYRFEIDIDFTEPITSD